MWFDSKGEANHHAGLALREKAGEISGLKTQVQVHLTDARILYKPDFFYFDNSLEECVWEEYKGIETPVWRIKRRLWKVYGPGRLRVVYSSGKMEELIPSGHGSSKLA